jgi:hypothetical protein
VLASNLSTEFGKKRFVTWRSATKHFVYAFLLVCKMGMQVCQHKPDEVEVEASDYMHLICPLLFGPHRNQRFILNMDQMPVYFLMSLKKTLEVVGVSTDHICMSTNNTKRATMAVMIAGDSMLLLLRIILKGKHNGCAAQTEFDTYPATHHYCCQEATWIGEQVILAWVEGDWHHMS